MKGIFRGCDMQNIEWKTALASFSAGEIGMMFWSTSALGAVERAKGDFELKTNEYPGHRSVRPEGPASWRQRGHACVFF
jgi:multiple sugar transport system substrate-binding protein